MLYRGLCARDDHRLRHLPDPQHGPRASAQRQPREALVGWRRLNREVEQIIAQGIADGSIRKCDPIALSFAMFGAFNWITYWYRSNGPLSPDEIADRFVDIFAHGAHPDRPTGG